MKDPTQKAAFATKMFIFQSPVLPFTCQMLGENAILPLRLSKNEEKSLLLFDRGYFIL